MKRVALAVVVILAVGAPMAHAAKRATVTGKLTGTRSSPRCARHRRARRVGERRLPGDLGPQVVGRKRRPDQDHGEGHAGDGHHRPCCGRGHAILQGRSAGDNLADVLGEINLQQSKYFDQSTRLTTAHLLRPNASVTGTMSRANGQLTVTAAYQDNHGRSGTVSVTGPEADLFGLHGDRLRLPDQSPVPAHRATVGVDAQAGAVGGRSAPSHRQHQLGLRRLLPLHVELHLRGCELTRATSSRRDRLRPRGIHAKRRSQ